ncbi:hypothetical protein K2173_013192 [Erythroxylum novogranatense]|uniref:Retrotransposon Copia-like N-terminal domain-containing protein n=1 Tax=Erythroxylum novogranatense TaxID=1862640 RepID=A0AAV8THD4_9ROSI|nr:hypothetical protein K2173_013192 [Erythroxylum novogranatense]
MAESLLPVTVAIDTKSPFYLHPSDHPGLVFVTQTLRENGENYYTWRRTFLNALQAKNKAGFLDGSIVRPDDDSPDLQAWIQCNALVLAWLSNALGKDHQDGTAHVETAREAWVNLEEQFTQGISPRIYELRRAINLWNELQASRPIPTCTCGAAKKMADMREEEKVFDFLMGLDDTFSTVRFQILALDPLPNLGKAYSIAAQDEKQALVRNARIWS